MDLKSVCVFCGASDNGDTAIEKAVVELSELLVTNQQTLVYGGGNIGIMGKVANSVMNKGGKVIGVIPRFLMEKEVGHYEITELIITENMHERKKKMSDLSDAFIVLPGGFGTLEEFFEVLTWLQLGLHSKPIGLLNVGGFYDMLIAQMEVMIERGLLKPYNRDLVQIDHNISALLDKMNDFCQICPDSWSIDRKLT